MSERTRPNLRKSWQRKHKKRGKKLSNCLAGLAICPHKKLGYNALGKATREKEADVELLGLVIYGGGLGSIQGGLCH